MLIDSICFRRLVESVARDASITASDACCAIKLARLVASLDHDEDPVERELLDNLSWEVCAVGGPHVAPFTFNPPASSEEYRERRDMLLHGLTSPAAGELVYALVVLLIEDRSRLSDPLLETLRLTLAISEPRAHEVADLARRATAEPVA